MKRTLILAAAVAALVFTSPASAQLGVGARLGANVGVGRHLGVNADANLNVSERERRRDYDRRHHRHHDRDGDDLRTSSYLAMQSRLNTRHYHAYGESQTRDSADWHHY